MGFLPKTLGYLADVASHLMAWLSCSAAMNNYNDNHGSPHCRRGGRALCSPLQPLIPAPRNGPDSQNVGPPPPQVSAPLPSSAAPEEDEAAQRLRETDFSTETNYAASSLYGRTSRSQFSFQIRFFFSPSHILLLCIVVMDGRLPNKMYKDDTE